MTSQADTDAQVVALWIHGRSRHTQRAYRTNAERFLVFPGKPVAQVSLGDIQAFADSLTFLAQSSQAQALAAVKSLLAFAHKIGYIRFNVDAAAHLPKAKNALAERILQESEVHRMFALEPNRRNRIILKTLCYAGLRVSELCGLRWLDLQPRGDEGQVTVFGKGGKTRAVLLPAGIWNELIALHDSANEDEPVFRSRLKAGPLDQSQILRIVRAAATRAGTSKKYLLIGCVTHTHRIASIAAPRFILCKPRSAMHQWRQRGDTFTPGQQSLPVSIWPNEYNRDRAPSLV